MRVHQLAWSSIFCARIILARLYLSEVNGKPSISILTFVFTNSFKYENFVTGLKFDLSISTSNCPQNCIQSSCVPLNFVISSFVSLHFYIVSFSRFIFSFTSFLSNLDLILSFDCSIFSSSASLCSSWSLSCSSSFNLV